MMTLYILGGFATVLSLLAFVISREANRWITVLGLALAALFCLVGWGQSSEAFGGLYRFDTLSRGLTLIALLGGLWTLLLGPAKKFEYPLMVLYGVAGMHVMASSPNLVVLLIALEVFSLPLYVLATWQRDERGFESGLKYFLLGTLAAAVFLYGIALYFGATGSFMAAAQGSGPLYVAAMFLILAALGFKVSMVPFQWWTPDVYQGSPTVVTLFMATAVKAAAFAALLRIFTPQGLETWGVAAAILIALTTIFGNLGALAQTEAKRLFAYSSIANAGYIALGLYGAAGQAAVPFYLLTYALATGIIFAVLSGLSNQDVPLERLRGLFSRKPLPAAAMGLSILSLLGLPPLAGFWAKYLVFQEAAKAGYYPLLVLALVTSAISAYYYLKVFFLLFSKPHDHAQAEDEAGAALAQRFGSSESMGGAVAAPLGATGTAFGTATMVPAVETGLGGRWWMLGALALLGLLSFFPGLGLRAFNQGLPPVVEVPKPFTKALSITSPSAGAELVAGSYSLQGTGLPSETLEIFDNEVKIGEALVGANGGWSFNLPSLPEAGRHLYQVRRIGDVQNAEVGVTVTAPSGELGFSQPAEGARVSAQGFSLRGTGKPGEVLEIFEDGVSLGRVTVDGGGLWSLQVPPAAAGNRVYEVRREGQAEGLKLNLVVEQGTAQACTQAFSLSNLQAGGTVSRPFRFGGVGSARSYTVTVKRGERVIGSKELPLSQACGWSYLSNPGAGEITYEVRETGKESEPALSTINLNVQ